MFSPASPDGPVARIAALKQAYFDACLLELRALKPGNVHVHADGHQMSVADFEISARVSVEPLCTPGASVGQRILGAVIATRAAVGCNTNLGIVLLAAPLIVAAERTSRAELRPALEATLQSLTAKDAAAAYQAIRLAAPAGLGEASEQDVAWAPTVDLRQAMALAAERDRIARQYATGYEDVFALGVARLAAARQSQRTPEWSATLAYMAFLARFPDSHIARKHGDVAADSVRAEAAALATGFMGAGDEARLTPKLLEFDRRLKRAGLNPGSTADLTVASLLACSCAAIITGA